MPLPIIDLETSAFLLDIDGTILDIAPTPHEVVVPDALRRTLTRLEQRTNGALALVSGRSLDDIDLIFAPLKLAAIGGHGAELRPHPNAEIAERRAAPLDDKIKRRLHEAAHRVPGIIVEDKDYSLALHYRLVPEQARAIESAVAAIHADLPPGTIEVLRGKAVLEIKPIGFNKGSAVRELMTFRPFRNRAPVFIGDDITDEYAFAVLPDFNGIGLSVGREVVGAAGRFASPREVRRWLARIAEEAPAASA